MADLQLVITLTDNGQVNVHGPISQKMVCYGMLECARDAIKDYNANPQPEPKIIPAHIDLSKLNGGY